MPSFSLSNLLFIHIFKCFSVSFILSFSLIFHLSTWLGWLRLPVGGGLAVAFCVGSWNNLKVWIFPDEASVSFGGRVRSVWVEVGVWGEAGVRGRLGLDGDRVGVWSRLVGVVTL